MFGYAVDDTPELMPAPIQLSHNILKLLADARHSGKEPLLAPDAKSQVTLQYRNGKPTGATAVVVSTQHALKDKKGRMLAEIGRTSSRERVCQYGEILGGAGSLKKKN